MRSQPSTTAQRALVAALGYELRYASQEYGPTGTYDEASAVSEWLLKIRRERWSSTPMHAAMRKADFAALRASGKTKENLYAALGIASLSDAARPSYLIGRRCRQWLDGKPLEPDHVTERSSIADGLSALSHSQYPRPPRPDGYVPIEFLRPDPVLHPRSGAFHAHVTPAPARPRGRPGFDPMTQPPKPVRQPVAASAPAKAAVPVVAPQQPIRRPIGCCGMPVRPVPVAQPTSVVAQPAPAPVVAVEPVTAIKDKGAEAEARPFARKPTPRSPVDTGSGRVEIMTQQRLAILNEMISTGRSIDYLTRIAMTNAPAWQFLESDFQTDIPF